MRQLFAASAARQFISYYRSAQHGYHRQITKSNTVTERRAGVNDVSSNVSSRLQTDDCLCFRSTDGDKIARS